MHSPLVIAVAGASGGLGTSTLAVAVGRRLAATGPPSVVVDLDLGGGGLDVTAGIEHLPGTRWPSLADVRGRVDPEAVLSSVPGEDGCRVLSTGGPAHGPVPVRAVEDVVASLLTGRGPVVLDVPPRGPLPDALVAARPVVLLLTSLRTRGLADADARLEDVVAAGEASGAPPDVRLVTRGPRPAADVLDDVVAHLGIAHLAHLADDPRVARDAERGLWPGTGRDAVRAAAAVAADLLSRTAEAS